MTRDLPAEVRRALAEARDALNRPPNPRPQRTPSTTSPPALQAIRGRFGFVKRRPLRERWEDRKDLA